MTRGGESQKRFVLVVEWDSVDAHAARSRATEAFRQGRALIGPWFAHRPRIEHFTDTD